MIVNKSSNKGLKSRIYDELKSKIMFCELLPGTLLVESEICKEYGVSRMPVREALLNLEKEGYVVINPRSSTKVSLISLREIKDIVEARCLIEKNILSTLSGSLPEDIIQTLQSLCGRFEELSEANGDGTSRVKMFLQLDYQFHSTLISLCTNNFLRSFALDLINRSVRYWYLMVANDEKRLIDAMREHKVITDAFIEGDFERVTKNVESHIKAFYNQMYIVD